MPRRVLAMMAASLLASIAAADPSAEGVVARVGGVPVTRHELARASERLLPARASFHGGVSREKRAAIREEAWQGLIERAYAVRYAQDQGIRIDRAALDARVGQITSSFKDGKQLEAALNGEPLDAFRASIERELLSAKAVELAITSRAKVTDAEVAAHYERNKQSFFRPRMLRASHIFLKVEPAASPADKEALRKKAEGLAARARAGEDFYNLAYYNSEEPTKMVGGDVGYFHEGQAEPELEAAMKDAQLNVVIGPVATLHGLEIFKLTDVKPAKQLSLEEVQADIRKTLVAQRAEELRTAWMGSLKRKWKVERLER